MKNKMNPSWRRENALGQIFLGAVVLLTVVSLSACGQKTDTNSDGATATKKVKKVTKNVETFAGIPDWAKKIGAVEPQGLEVISDSFVVREDDDSKNIRQSFKIRYRGATKDLFKQAKEMTTTMGAKVDFEDELEFLGSGTLGGNYTVTVGVKTDTKSKYVDEPFLYYNVEKKYSPKN